MAEQQEEVKGSEVVEPSSNIVIESFEDDMRAMGVEIPKAQESKDDLQSPKEDEQKVEDVKKSDDTQSSKKQTRAQRRIQRQQDEIKALKEQINEQESKPAKAKEEAVEPEPEDFENYEDYETALAEYEKPAKKPDTKPAKKQDDGLADRIAEMKEDGIEDYPDFEELVSDKDLPLTEDIIKEVLDSESPSDVVYYLAKNKAETIKIAKMSLKQIQKAILKIELKLEEKPSVNTLKAASSAPEPINPIEGNSPEIRSPETAKSYDEFERMRNAQRSKSGW